VRSAAAINVLPLTSWSNLPTQRAGHAEQSIGGMEVRLITPAYFETMQIPVIRGRSFTGSDRNATPPVIVVNETLARRWWPRGNAIGDQIVIGQFQGRDFPDIRDVAREVVGIVADTKTAFLKKPPLPTVYVPAAQVSDQTARSTDAMAWVVRATFRLDARMSCGG